MKISFYIILCLVAACLVQSCSHKLNISKLKLNKENNFYTYKYRGEHLAIRNFDNSLVTPSNIKPFLLEIDSCNYRYKIEQILETDYFINRDDATLVNLYSGIITSININNPDAAFYFALQFKNLHPQYFKYSDVDFLEGKAWELKNNRDSSIYYYNRFLTYSSRKYPSRFRGYMFNDSAKLMFSKEREYANFFVADNSIDRPGIMFQPIIPKFYYQSFHPGYVLNREDIGMKMFVLPGFSLMGSTSEITYWGLNTAFLINEKFVLYLAASSSDFQNDYMIAAPYQLFKASNNRLGVKITPMLYVNTFKKTSRSAKVSAPYMNGGVAVSLGYQLNCKFSFGVSYLGYFYNQYYKHKVENSDNELYLENEFDISMYYQMLKGISLKAGALNGNLTLGFVFTGSFLGYNSRNRGLSYKFSVH
jgi:hypothetical protein